MKIARASTPKVTGRQLFEHAPEAKRIVDRFDAGYDYKIDTATAASLAESLRHGAEKSEETRNGAAVMTAAAAGFGTLLGLAVGGWAGIAVGAVGVLAAGFMGWHAAKHLFEGLQRRADADQIEGPLAQKAARALVSKQSDGTTVDNRFWNNEHIHNPQEVSCQGKVISRSLEYVTKSREKLTFHEDTARGTVTVTGGDYGEGTFKGSLELPTREQPEGRIHRQPDGTVMRFNDEGEVHIGLEGEDDMQGNLGCGLRLTRDKQGRSILLQAPADLEGFVQQKRGELTRGINYNLDLKTTVDVPKLGPLEKAEVREQPSGAEFFPLGYEVMRLDYDDQRHEVTVSSERANSRTVKGDLQSDGRIRMQQGKAEVFQTLEAADVRLTVKQGKQQVALQHVPGEAPRADVPVLQLADGSYELKLKSGPVKVAPALSMDYLRANQKPHRPLGYRRD